MRVANHICHVFPSTSTQTWKNMKKHHPWVVSIHLPFASKIRWPKRPLFSTCANMLDGLDPPSKLPFWAASLWGWEDLVDSKQHMWRSETTHILSMSWKHRQTRTPPKHRYLWATFQGVKLQTLIEKKKKKRMKNKARTCDFINLCFSSAGYGSNFSCLPRPSTEKRGLPVRCRSSGNLVVSWKRQKMQENLWLVASFTDATPETAAPHW